MGSLQDIYKAINENGFVESTLQLIDKYVEDIINGTRDFYRFNVSEHAGFCKAGPILIGASIVASYATTGLAASRNARSGQASKSIVA